MYVMDWIKSSPNASWSPSVGGPVGLLAYGVWDRRFGFVFYSCAEWSQSADYVAVA